MIGYYSQSFVDALNISFLILLLNMVYRLRLGCTRTIKIEYHTFESLMVFSLLVCCCSSSSSSFLCWFVRFCFHYLTFQVTASPLFMFIRKYFTSLIFRKYWAQSGGSGCGQKPQMPIHTHMLIHFLVSQTENGVLVWREGMFYMCEILTEYIQLIYIYEWKYDKMRHHTNGKNTCIWKRKTNNEFNMIKIPPIHNYRCIDQFQLRNFSDRQSFFRFLFFFFWQRWKWMMSCDVSSIVQSTAKRSSVLKR